MTEKSILHEIKNKNVIEDLFGNLEYKVNIIEQELSVKLAIVNDGIKVIGDELFIQMTCGLLDIIIPEIIKSGSISLQQLNYSIDMIKQGNSEAIKHVLDSVICSTAKGKALKPKTLGQKNYVDMISKNDIVFGIGPAGTGKTFLAMAMAVKAFKNNEVDRIILTRPAVEAGENLGFLPGDLQEKIDPYLRPLYDALFEILGYDNYLKLMEKGLIEVAPLAYMRGRTLDNSYIILDEAQNTTNEQMKMFLTRIGYSSKAIITGDITQVDLPRGKISGLVTAKKILSNVKGISFMEFKKEDIVRHPLVQRIIDAYEKYEKVD